MMNHAVSAPSFNLTKEMGYYRSLILITFDILLIQGQLHLSADTLKC